MQEMKAQYASGMQLYCQKANVVLPPSVSSTPAGTCSAMVSKGITPIICSVIPQYFQLAFAFLSYGKNVGIYHHHHHVMCACAYLCFVCACLSVETTCERLNHLTNFHKFLQEWTYDIGAVDAKGRNSNLCDSLHSECTKLSYDQITVVQYSQSVFYSYKNSWVDSICFNKRQSMSDVGIDLSDVFCIYYGLKQGE